MLSVNLAIGLAKVVDHKLCGHLNASLVNLANLPDLVLLPSSAS